MMLNKKKMNGKRSEQEMCTVFRGRKASISNFELAWHVSHLLELIYDF